RRGRPPGPWPGGRAPGRRGPAGARPRLRRGIAVLRHVAGGRRETVGGRVTYDETGLFRENADEAGLEWKGPPAVARRDVEVADGRRVSALVWGDADPDLVLLHGGAQNSHTWDTVALALDRPLVAIDLPGHGHSSHRPDHVYWPADNAVAVEQAVRALAPDARVVVGMSLGGLTSIALADRAPELV